MGFLLPALTPGEARQPARRRQERAAAAVRQPALRAGAREARSRRSIRPATPITTARSARWPTCRRRSLGDVSAFFRTYYNPNNASLCIAGDFDSAETKRLVAKYFGPIPAGPEVANLEPSVPKLAEPKHVTMTDASRSPGPSWSGRPSRGATGRAGDRRPGGDSRRARQGEPALPGVDVRSPARGRGLGQPPDECLSGEFEVVIEARPGQDLDEIVKIADAEIARLKAEGPTESEVMKAQNTRESREYRRAPVDPAAGRLPQRVQRQFRRPAGLQGRDAQALRRDAGRRQAGGEPVPDRRPGPARRRPGRADTPARRGRGRSPAQAPLASPTAVGDQGHVRSLGDAQGRPGARSSPRRRSCGGGSRTGWRC